jgi:multiple sugar transport system permease protein
VTVLLFGIIVLCSASMLLVQLRRRRPLPTDASADADEAASSARTSLRFARDRVAGRRPAAPATTTDDDVYRPLVRLPARVSRLAFGIGAGLLLFFFVAPIAWIAIASFQSDAALNNMPPHLSPTIYLDGYARILGSPAWRGSLVVSLLTAILTATFVILIAAPSAYSLARFALPGKRAFLAVLVVLQMVPAIVMAIPVLRTFQILGLKDTVAALVIVNVAFWLPLIVWLLRNFFNEVPVALERAARIDGCSRLGTLFRVTIPAARPGIAAAAILILIGTWNEFLFAVILGDHNAVTITRLITSIESLPSISAEESLPPNLLAAGAMVAVTPCLLLVVLFHRRIITGLTEGLIKG